MKRREFLEKGIILSAGSLINFKTGWGSYAIAAEAQETTQPILVTVFLRGAMDGISMLPPIDDPEYFKIRPTVQIANSADVKFKEGFGLHPSLAQVRKIVSNGEGVFLFGAGSPSTTRSHFDAQDWMESGQTQTSSLQTGFLGRAASFLSPKQEQQNVTSVVALQSGLPRILKGADGAIAFPNFKATHIKGPLTRDKVGEDDAEMRLDPAFYQLYTKSQDSLFKNAALPVVDGLPVFAKAEELFSQLGDAVPKNPLGKSLAHIQALIKSESGLRMAVTEMGGWDTHVNQGNAEKGALRDRLSDLDEALAFFWNGLDANKRQKVVVVVMTEFGRTAAENGDHGTDHGHGSTYLVLSTKANRKGVLHKFKGLRKDLLNEGRDLIVDFDYRAIFSEILQEHMKISVEKNNIFPNYSPQGKLGILNT